MLDGSVAYYEDTRQVNESLNCVCANDIVSKWGVTLVEKGSIINPQSVDFLVKHNINKIRVFKKVGNKYSSQAEVVEDILVSYRKVIKNIINGTAISIEFKDQLFEILFYFNKLNFKSMIAYIKYIESLDNFTYSHSLSISWLIIRLGVLLKFDDESLKDLMQVGLFHDIGKISIPSNIINKKGKLTDEEFSLIKRHPTLGYTMINGLVNDNISLGVLQHHEKLNGKGYPSGLFDKDIVLFARILCVADVFEALVAERPYKKRLTYVQALNILRDMAFLNELDYKLVELFTVSVMDSLIGEILTDKDGEKRLCLGYNKTTLEPFFWK